MRYKLTGYPAGGEQRVTLYTDADSLADLKSTAKLLGLDRPKATPLEDEPGPPVMLPADPEPAPVGQADTFAAQSHEFIRGQFADLRMRIDTILRNQQGTAGQLHRIEQKSDSDGIGIASAVVGAFGVSIAFGPALLSSIAFMLGCCAVVFGMIGFFDALFRRSSLGLPALGGIAGVVAIVLSSMASLSDKIQ